MFEYCKKCYMARWSYEGGDESKPLGYVCKRGTRTCLALDINHEYTKERDCLNDILSRLTDDYEKECIRNAINNVETKINETKWNNRICK